MTEHTFKVVHITETNEIEPVPHQWEEKGYLYWPDSKQEIRKFQSNAGSIPNKEKWLKYKCVVKETGLLFYEHATSAADNFCNLTSEDETGGTTKSVVTVVNNKASYDSVFHQTETDFDRPEENVNVTTTDELSFCSVIPTSEITKLISLFEEFKINTEQKLAELSAKQDRLERLIVTQINVIVRDVDEERTSAIFPIDSVEEMQKFEDQLKNNDYREKIVAYLKRIIGSGQAWKSASYRLSSTLFTKKVLTYYSWTGVSRKDKKDAFVKLDNILDLFFQVIYYADSSFNHALKEKFFKEGILKHSQSRFNPKKKSQDLQAEEFDRDETASNAEDDNDDKNE